jgi:L-iditol 2-dehydrogenase
VPRPEPQSGDALIKVMASGICGSDMHAFLGHDARRPAPLVLGHEAAGIVVGGPDDGRRVTLNPLVTCGECPECVAGRTNNCAHRQIISMPPRPGAFADYVALPRGNLVTVPDDMPLEKAALAEPIACGWHAVRVGCAAHPKPNADIKAMAIGGGAIGYGAALCLLAQGVKSVTLIEPNETRRNYLIANSGGRIEFPTNPVDSEQFDLVIDGVGFAATRATASRVAAPGGVIVHIGLGEAAGGLDIRRMTLQEIAFIGTYAYTADDFRKTAAAIFDGGLGPLDWIEKRPLSDGLQAFRDIRAGRTPAPKTMLFPDHAMS